MFICVLLQDFCRLYGIRPDADRHDTATSATTRHQRLLSEADVPSSADINACSVEDVLRLLQLLYAISRDGNIKSNITGSIAVVDLERFQVCPSSVFL